jgi:DNA-binding beta-propeller fold protein YncE
MKSDYSCLKLGLVIGLCLIVCSGPMKAAGYALSFNATQGQSVNIPHKAAQNGYPFTVMCWFQEPASSSGGGALVNKYISSSYNGWMIAIGGQLHAFYYRDGSDFIGNTGAGAVNDGLWHQGAFVVDASGGHLYLDGVLKQTVAWTGTPGACTTTNPIVLGLYPGDSFYSGQLDEVSVWNVALTQSQVQTYMRQALTGTETGLVDYYQLNEGTGTNIYDATVNADTGTFSANPPTWVLSPVLEPQLGATNLVEGPSAGNDTVVLAVSSLTATWIATANASWLHVANANGVGSTNFIFSFDVNPGVTRIGTLTIDGQTLTVVQAASTYRTAPANLTTLASSGLSAPAGVSVDNNGNVYIADAYNNAIKKWTATNNSVTTLVASGLNNPFGVAVDNAGSVYIADTHNNAIKKWTPANNTVTTLVSSGLNLPYNVAVDNAGNVYIADLGNNAIKKWTAANNTVTTLVASGLNQPYDVALDKAGNVYIADKGNNAIKKWTAANNTVTTLLTSGLNQPFGVAVDGSGNIYIADTYNNAIKKWTAVNNTVTTLIPSVLDELWGVAVDSTGNVYFSDAGLTLVDELPRAFVDQGPKTESAAAGTDALLAVLPSTENLMPPFAPVSDQSWLTINGVTGFSFTATISNRMANITVLGLPVPIVQEGPKGFLGTTNLVEGPAAGIDSVVLALVPNVAASWTATANVSWLHLAPPYQSGTGSTNVIFSFDANSGATRVGTLTIDGQTLTLIQAGATYVANPASTTTLVSSGLSYPNGIAVDGSGNVYIADTTNNAIKKWTATNNTVITLVAAGLNQPFGVAVDGSGNVYIADTTHNAIKKWVATNNTVITLVSSGLNQPVGVAVDNAGNVYIADQGNNAVKKWTAANNTVTTLIAAGLNQPSGMAVDYAGNVYIADRGNNAIKKWTAANNTVTTLIAAGLNQPFGVAMDYAGNVYVADTSSSAIKKWTAANNSVTTLVASGLNQPFGVAVDNAGNVYIADTSHNVVDELPRAFIDPTAKIEGLPSGSDTLPVVLPANENLMAPFTPASDQSWLTINGVTNGVTGFSFNTSTSNRVANISVLGVPIPIVQERLDAFLGTTNLVEGPAAGIDSVVLALVPNIASPWTATANASWLHLDVTAQSGLGSTNVVFTFDANSGATRVGTLTIDGQSLTVIQAGATYVANPASTTTLVSSGLSHPNGIAVDSAGNIYIADTNNNAIKKWTATNNTVITLVAAGLNQPSGVAVDGSGNVYIADTYNNVIKKWTAADNTVTTLIAAGLNQPSGVAVDYAGNVYIADQGNNAIKKWTAANNSVTTMVDSGLNQPFGLAVDYAGNVYIADQGNNAIKKWTAANNSVTALVSSGLNQPFGVAVDGSGNVYVANGDGSIQEWIATTQNLIYLPFAGINKPWGVAVDSAGNVYVADEGNNVVYELPRAFIDPTAKIEGLSSGSDTLPAVLPSTENLMPPFVPLSDQSWLTINGVTNGVTGFSFNTSTSNRVANITVLGLPIPMVQGGPNFFLGTTNLVEGPAAGIDSVVLALVPNIASPWTATADASWLHLDVTAQSGLGSTNVIFTFDANSGATRIGTLTIGGQSLTVIQAGATYVANPASTTTLVSSGLSYPNGIAVDNAGNVYIADTFNKAIKKWTAASNSVTTLISSGLKGPYGVAVDNAGNVYVADAYSSTIKKWTATNNSVTTLVASGLNYPYGVAVDGSGNVYIADTYNNLIKKWTVANNSVTTLVSSGLNFPAGVALDGSGNVYIVDEYNKAIKKWTAANNSVTALVSSGLNFPYGLAVDGSGNVYIADTSNLAIKKWVAANNTVTTLVASGLKRPFGVAVNSFGNVYIADDGNNAVYELPRAFIDLTPKNEGLFAGNDVLPPVLPSTEYLTSPFAPASNQSWLTINGVTNGVVAFSFTTCTNLVRTANISVLGELISVTQSNWLVTPPLLTGAKTFGDGTFQFTFTGTPGTPFTVMSTTNLALPLANWTMLGSPSNLASNLFQFTSQPQTNDPQRFYRVSSP